MYKQAFTLDFSSQARTLDASEFLKHSVVTGEFSYTHPESGWTITGVISGDWYYWVNDFVARHPTFGYVKGNFEVEVQAKSKKALGHFMEWHAPKEWDYDDI